MTAILDPSRLSLRDKVALLPEDQRADYVSSLTDEEVRGFTRGDWAYVARPDQLPPKTPWTYWFIRAGRGWGKTRTGAEATKEKLAEVAPHVNNDEGMRWALTSPREADVLRTQIEGESGLLRCIPPSWLVNGNVTDSLNRGGLLLKLMVHGRYPAILEGFSARVLDSTRGRSFHGGWSDEPGTYSDAHNGLDGDERGESFMGNLLLGMRLQPFGGVIITGTPKNNRLIRQLRDLNGLHETVGSTRENLHNLAQAFADSVVARYVGTRLGRQELEGEILEGIGDLFQRGWFRPLAPGAWPWPEGTLTRWIRYWDLASGTESDSNPNPDWTVGTRIVLDAERRLYVIDHVERFRKGVGEREVQMGNVAVRDGAYVEQVVEAEPGNAGTAQLHAIARELDTRGINLHRYPESGSISGKKEIRAEIPALAAAQGRVYMRAANEHGDWGQWQLDALDEAEEFPNGDHDDIVDTWSGGFAYLREAGPGKLLWSPNHAGATPTKIPTPAQARRSGSTPSGRRMPKPRAGR